MSDAAATLAAGLYGALAAGPGNLALSPYSVAVALAMTQHGAVGETREQIRAVLGGETPGRLPAPGAGVVLAAADALFAQEGVAFEPAFVEALAREYDAALHPVDFVGAPERARAAVNDWTAQRTRGRITEIVSAGAVSEATRLVLVDALYLKAPWARPFEEHLTADAPFHLADGRTVAVPTMRAPLGVQALGRGDGWLAVPVPYAGGRLALTVVLPDPGRLADVEAAVADGALPAMLASPTPEPVDLSLPRWTVRCHVPLRAALERLGMVLPFSAAADLSAMTADEAVAVDEVLHQAHVAVDEHGTEAAAATAVVVRATSLVPRPEPTRVVVDRPFLFVVHDVALGTPLFLGRVSDPTT